MGMNVWSSLGSLAQFPGTLVLGDARPAQEAYPSEGVSSESLALLEPHLSPTAAAQGARLYRQEGGQPIGPHQSTVLAGLIRWRLPHAREALHHAIKADNPRALPLSHIAQTCADKRVCHKEGTQSISIDQFC